MTAVTDHDPADGPHHPEEDPAPDLREQVPPPSTGDADVDRAVQELARLAGSPVEEQVGGYERVHRALQDRLADGES